MNMTTGSLRILLFSLGVAIILLLSGLFFSVGISFRYMFISVGLMVIISAFYYEFIDGKIVSRYTTTYFVAMFSINVFQWFILVYTLFISQINVMFQIFIVLFIAPLMTISLIFQFFSKHLQHLRDSQKTSRSMILADKMNVMFKDKSKAFLIFVGILTIVGFLTCFIEFKSPFALFGSSVGIVIIIYGLYRENSKIKAASFNYSPGMAHNYMYRDIKKVKVTPTYFVLMLLVLLFQWLLLYYIIFYNFKTSDADVGSLAFVFTFNFTIFFYIQIRESHLIRITWQGTYIGKKKIL